MKPLYKYVIPSSASIILKNQSIKITNPDEFNDPFDCNIPNFSISKAHKKVIYKVLLKKNGIYNNKNIIEELDGDFQKLVDELKEISTELVSKWSDLIKEFRVLSLTEKSDNILMWSHYAQNHTGIVLGFKHQESGFLRDSRKVSYINGQQKLNEFTKNAFVFLAKYISSNSNDLIEDILSDKLSDITLNLLSEYFLIKKYDWKYEYEHRLILNRKSELISSSESLDVITFNKDELCEVIFGIKTDEKLENECMEIIKNIYPNIKRYKAKKSGLHLILTEI